jgi:predicted nucleic acid-binding protein
MNAVDTNILVYAISADETVKGPVAMTLLDSLSAADTILLWQVTCEFGAVLAKLYARGQADSNAFAALAAWRSRFPLVMPHPAVLDRGLEIHREHGISYWDALLLAACVDAGVDRMYLARPSAATKRV